MTEEKLVEILAKIEVRLSHLEKSMSNHLTHHFRYNILAWSVALSALVSLTTLIISLLIK